MRLLHVEQLGLREFRDNQRPRYVIASHRWRESTEATFQDVQNKRNTDKDGYKKIEAFAAYVRGHLPWVKWLWIDTCCINKNSAAEISEAVNLMFEWYRSAQLCVAYLADVEAADDRSSFVRSAWFTRGWTLPELLAPRTVVFVAKGWQTIGSKGYLAHDRNIGFSWPRLERDLARITGIPEHVLHDFKTSSSLSVDQRLKWMEGRSTTREEDMSYALYGVFDVAPGANYGENYERARRRLLAAISYHQIVDWLSPVDAWTSHASARSLHEPQTGTWLIESDQYRRWKSGATRHMWMHGKAGCGKTILCSTAIEDVKEHCEHHPTAGYAVFYFSLSDDKKQRLADLLLALVAQLAWKGRTLSMLQQAYDKPNRSLLGLDELENIMLSCFEAYDEVFLLIDALDQCPEDGGLRHSMLECLVRLSRRAPRVKILATSRDLLDIRTSMTALLSEALPLATRFVDADIQQYVAKQLLRDYRLSRLDQKTKTLFEEKISAKADGSFRWAYFQVQKLKQLKLTSPTSITKALHALRSTVRSIQLDQEAVDTTPPDHPDRTGRLPSFAVEYHFTRRTKKRETDILAVVAKDAGSEDAGSEDAGSEGASGYVPSLFTDASMASSATTASGLGSIPEAHIQHLIKALFCTEELLPISLAALTTLQVSPERFERSVRRLVAKFGRGTRLEGRNKDEHGAGSLLRTRHNSAFIAREIVNYCDLQNRSVADVAAMSKPEYQDRLNTTASNFEQADPRDDRSEVSDESSGNDEQQPEEDSDYERIERFLLSCQAYSAFRLGLLDFVHSFYQTRISKALGRGVTLDTGEYLTGADLNAIEREVSWIPAHILSFSSKEDLSFWDLLKRKVEDAMGEKWNWWPLSRTKYPLQQGFVRMKWRTPCEEQRHIDIPEASAQLLQNTVATAPSFVNEAITIDMRSLSPRQAPASQPSGSGIAGTNLPTAPPGSNAQPSQTGAAGMTPSIPSIPSSYQFHPQIGFSAPLNSSNNHLQQHRARHVFICIRTGLFTDQHKVKELRSDLLGSDDDFYDRVKEAYIYNRGTLRHWFSPWRYHHCDFYQFHKRYEVEPSKIDFPADHHPDYEFTPCPLQNDWRPPHGPIMATSFNHNYYGCQNFCHSWHRHRYRKNRYQQHDDIQSLPQRKHCIDLDDGQNEVFWGIYAREERCFTWIMTYGVIINIPGTVFFFMWLFSWGHASDLQNAAVPLTFSTTLTILFVGLLYESKEGKS